MVRVTENQVLQVNTLRVLLTLLISTRYLYQLVEQVVVLVITDVVVMEAHLHSETTVAVVEDKVLTETNSMTVH